MNEFEQNNYFFVAVKLNLITENKKIDKKIKKSCNFEIFLL